MKRIWKKKTRGGGKRSGADANSGVPSSSAEDDSVFASLPVEDGEDRNALTPRRTTMPGAFRVSGIDGFSNDDVSFQEYDQNSPPPSSMDDIIVPNATLVESTASNDDVPLVFAEKGVRHINLRDRRVRIGLVLIFIVIVGLVVGLVISQRKEDSALDMSSLAPSTATSEFPSASPSISLSPTSMPTLHPTSLSWVQLGSGLEFAGGFETRGGLLPIFLSEDGTRISVGARQYFPACCGIYLATEIYESDPVNGAWFNVLENNGIYDHFSADDTIVAMSGDGRRVAMSSVLNKAANETTVVIIDDSGGAGDFVEIGGPIFGDWLDDKFGWSVSLSGSGNIVSIGAYLNDNNGTDSGLVQVYKLLDDSVWVPRGSVQGAGSMYGFGISVSLSDDGNRVAVGSSYQNATCAAQVLSRGGGGEVRVYEYDGYGSSWKQIGQVIGAMCDASVSVSRDGTTLAIGLPRYLNQEEGINLFNSGVVQVYEYMENNDRWVQRGDNITGSDLNSALGTSVSLSSDGRCVAIGTLFGMNDLDETTGSASVYRFEANGSWHVFGDAIHGEAVGDAFGSSVSLSSNCSIVAISAPENRGMDGVARGQVRVFEFQGI